MERDHGHHIDQRGKSFSLADHYSWPHPQIRLSSPSTSYSCCYCKRKFRSPQGLGGHMNVHRWDRARRIHGQCSAHRLASPLNNPSPNGRVIDLSLAKMPHRTGDDDGSAAAVTKTDVCHFTSSASSTVTKDFKVKNFESGTGVHSHHDDGTEDRLDLELRLGCS